MPKDPTKNNLDFYLLDEDDDSVKYFDDNFSDDPIYSSLCTSKLRYMNERLDEDTMRMLIDF